MKLLEKKITLEIYGDFRCSRYAQHHYGWTWLVTLNDFCSDFLIEIVHFSLNSVDQDSFCSFVCLGYATLIWSKIAFSGNAFKPRIKVVLKNER